MADSINDLIEKVRSGEIEGSIEIVIRDKGKVNRIKIRKENDFPIRRTEVDGLSLEKTDLSGMNLSNSDLSGLNLSGANLSYATINDADLSYTNLEQANLYKARISQTDMSKSAGANTSGAYMTGSVNLYNPQSGVDWHPWGETVRERFGVGGSEQASPGYDVFSARERKNRYGY